MWRKSQIQIEMPISGDYKDALIRCHVNDKYKWKIEVAMLTT